MSNITAYSIQFNGSDAYAQAPSVGAYDFGTGDFTAEAWVLTKKGGPVVTQMGGNESIGRGWGLFVKPDGNVEFLTFDNGDSMVATSQSAPSIFDGSWHHLAVVREGVNVYIYFDGVPLPLNVQINGSAPPINVSGNLPLTVGATSLVGHQSTRQYFTGSVDEVRVWNTALAAWKIDQNIYHIITQDKEHLVAQYGFDKKTGLDTSGKNNNLTFHGGVLFGDPGFYFVPEGQPFLAVQTRLMEDYHYDATKPGQAPKPVKAIRFAVSPRNSDGTKRNATLTLTTDQNTTIYNKGKSYPIGPATPVKLETNISHQINAGIFLDNEKLVAPVLKVHADFMKTKERIVVPLDRQVHHKLSMTSGKDLQEGNNPVLPSADFSKAQADSVAKTVNNVMTAAVQHDMQPADPIVRKRGTPFHNVALSSRRVVQKSASPGKPEVENYLPVEMENPILMSTSDLVRGHYLAQNGPIERVVIPTFMPDPHFSFDVKTKTFSPLSQSEADVSFTDNHGEQLNISTMVESDFEVATSLWDQFVNGVLDVVNIVVSVGSAIADGMRVAITFVVNGVKKVLHYVVGAVSEAAEFVVGFFKAIKVAIQKVVDFLSALFDWDDILTTHRVMARFIDQSMDFGLAVIKDLKSSADQLFDDAKCTVDTYFDKAINKLKQDSAGKLGEGSNLDQPASLQADYVNQHLSESDPASSKPNVSNIPSASALDSLLSGVNTSAANNHLDTLVTNNTTAVKDFASNVEGVLNEVLATFLTGIKASLDMAIDLAKTITDVLFDFLITSFSMLKTLVTTRINIPVITWVYENVITNDGSKLTALDFSALLAAVPLTVFYKLFRGGAPFPASFEQQFSQMTWQQYGFYSLPSAHSANNAPVTPMAFEKVELLDADAFDWKTPLSAGQSLVFAGSVVFWFGGVAAADEAGHNVMSPSFDAGLFTPIIGAQFIAQIGSYPIHDSYTKDKPSSLEVAIWALQFLPLALDCTNLVINKTGTKNAKITKFVNKVEDPLVGTWGVIHALMFLVLFIWEEIDNAKDDSIDQSEKVKNGLDSAGKFVSNVITCLPEIIGFIRIGASDPKVKTALSLTDIASLAAVFLITMVRIIASINRNVTIQAR